MAPRWDTIQVDNDPMRVYIDVPSGPGPHPGVVVAQTVAGVNEFIQAMVERLAQEGYVAAAPDLYHRQKDNILEEVARMPRDHPDRLPMLLSKGERTLDLEIVADVNATVEHMRNLPGSPVGLVGITGFCGGGRTTYLMAASNPELRAAAVFYGGNVMKGRGGPSPFEITANISCPLMGFFGDDDRNPSPEDVAKIDAELTRCGKPHVFHSYPGTGHGFQDFTSPESYREEAAKDSWTRALGFFGRHLKA